VIRSLGEKVPRIHPTAFVSEAAYVVGDVEIGEGSSIWPGTVIRGNNHKIKIGKYVNIQDNCVIHADADANYGDYVTLGHMVMCHATTVEEHCLLGNGAIVNGNAIIRHHSIVAAGSVVLERVEIPPNSFVTGAPGEVRNQVTERHLQMLDTLPMNYHRNGQIFKEAGLQDPDMDKFSDPNV
jgi:carbonic anhydrase/acetyltransferase-like protein (isoleucine patch superfamily)